MNAKRRLTELEQSNILKQFPKIELSYEKMSHNKVLTVQDGEVFSAIPQGCKYFAWFKSPKECYLLKIEEKKTISAILPFVSSLSSTTEYGIVFYGTLIFYKNKNNHFCMEDVFYYAHKKVNHYSYANKLQLYAQFLQKQGQGQGQEGQEGQGQQYKQLIFGLPIITTSPSDLYSRICGLHYRIHHIQYYKNNYKHNMFYENKEQSVIQQSIQKQSIQKKHHVFKVKPDIQHDIYHLYEEDNVTKKEEYVDIAYIASYTTSVMMNKLFRNIKENANLDFLEESDDEEEFENQQPHKFVYLDRCYSMNCVYNSKFKKWMPLSISTTKN